MASTSTNSASNEASKVHPSFKDFRPPVYRDLAKPNISVFLAGSIEMGVAPQWQRTVTQALSHLPVTVCNPRRDDWEAGWIQDISFEPFRTQVEWELDHLEKVDLIVLYMDPSTKAPITFYEMGRFATSGKMMVSCPEGFYRRGNVQINCARDNIPLLGSLDELIETAKQRIEKLVAERA